MNESEAPRVVFDCMVFLQGAARETSPARACLNLAEEGIVELCLSAPILAEVKDVLTRPETQKRFPDLTTPDVEEFLENISSQAVIYLNIPEEFRYPRDPKDEPYVNLALVARAKYLVTRDSDLLDLMDESTEEGRAFRFKYPFLTILDPVAFLKEITKRNQKSSS